MSSDRPNNMQPARPYGSLASFLDNAKRTLHSAIISQQRVTIVLGDDSADLDSITSSILYAYLRSSASSETPLTNTFVNRHLPTYQYPPLYIPVVNSSARALRDRPEILKVLEQTKLNPDHLIALDDLETEPPAGLNPDNTSKLSPQATRIMLTGQNKLTGPLSPAFNTCVVGHIDNAHDESISPSPKITEPRISAKAAACTSLVVKQYHMLWNRLIWANSDDANIDSAQDRDAPSNLTDSAQHLAWDYQLGELATSTILLATNNLTDQVITTDSDTTAVRYLEEMILSRGPSWNRDEFFQSIS